MNKSNKQLTVINRTQKDILKTLDEITTDYSDIELSDTEYNQLNKQLKRISIGSAGFTLLNCQGANCPFSNQCSLVQMRPSGHVLHGKAPVGKSCLLEANLFRDATANYIQEYDVEPSNFTEYNIITELAEIEVLLWRLNMTLSLPQNATLVIDQVISIDPTTGQPVVQQQVSPIFEQKQKLANRKTKLTKLMVGDRQEKYKKEAALKQKPEADASSSMAKIKQDLQKLQLSITNKLEGPVIEGQIVTPEDLIAGVESDNNKSEDQ